MPQINLEGVLLDLETSKIKIEAAIAAVRIAQGAPIQKEEARGAGMGNMGNIGICRSCSAKIIWMKTKRGKNIPVNHSKSLLGQREFVYGQMVAHFTTCPNANSHRRGDQHET